MKYVKLTLNFILKVTFFYLFFATWISLYSKNAILNLSVSAILTILAVSVLHIISKKREEKRNIKSTEKKDCEKLIENLKCIPESEQKKFVKSIYKNSNFYFNFNKLCIEDYYKIIQQAKKQNTNSIKVFCSETDANLSIKCQNQKTIEIEFLDKFDIYKLCKEQNIFPAVAVEEKSKTKITFKVLLSNLFNKKRAKQYLAFSILMLIFSFFTFFKIYYIVSSTIFLLLSLLCFFEDKLKTKKINPQM